MQCWPTNSRPLEHESSPITTRPVADLFGGNLEYLDFPLHHNSKNRPFKKQMKRFTE